MMRVCTRCQEPKNLAEFNADCRGPGGLNTGCRPCIARYKAEWRTANREKANSYGRKYTERNPERVRASKLVYFEANKEKALAAARKWQAENTHARNAATARRYVRKKQATPPWACRYIIEWYYFDALWMTEQTGVAHQVDHVVPLRGKTVCGLHCEDNLQVIPAAANHRKHAKFE